MISGPIPQGLHAIPVRHQAVAGFHTPTPSKGSGRVRHQCSGFVCDGNGPLPHLRAERTLIPAFAAAVSRVLPSIRFCLSSPTCRSVINGTSVPNDYPISIGKNSRRYRGHATREYG